MKLIQKQNAELILICKIQNTCLILGSSTVAAFATNKDFSTVNLCGKTMYSPRLIKMTDNAHNNTAQPTMSFALCIAATVTSSSGNVLLCIVYKLLHMYDLRAIIWIKLHVKFGIYTHKFISMAFWKMILFSFKFETKFIVLRLNKIFEY